MLTLPRFYAIFSALFEKETLQTDYGFCLNLFFTFKVAFDFFLVEKRKLSFLPTSSQIKIQRNIKTEIRIQKI